MRPPPGGPVLPDPYKYWTAFTPYLTSVHWRILILEYFSSCRLILSSFFFERGDCLYNYCRALCPQTDVTVITGTAAPTACAGAASPWCVGWYHRTWAGSAAEGQSRFSQCQSHNLWSLAWHVLSRAPTSWSGYRNAVHRRSSKQGVNCTPPLARGAPTVVSCCTIAVLHPRPASSSCTVALPLAAFSSMQWRCCFCCRLCEQSATALVVAWWQGGHRVSAPLSPQEAA